MTPNRDVQHRINLSTKASVHESSALEGNKDDITTRYKEVNSPTHSGDVRA